MMSVTYKIIPIDLNRPDGSAEPVHPSVIYYKAFDGDMYEMSFGCFALKNNETDEIIMVDTGMASQEWMKENNYPFHYEKLDGAPSLKEVLDRKRIDPAAVKTIIFTHLHQDHCCNLELFPNAKMYVQKIELQHAVTPTPVEWTSYQKLGLPGTPYWARAFHQLATVNGDCEIADGIRVWLTPGHTPGSQTVVVDTKEGPYVLAGDNYYNIEQFETGRMNGNFTNLEDWYEGRDRIMKFMKGTGARLLLVHDPATYGQEFYG